MPGKKDDLVSKLVPDPAKPVEYMVLRGFSGSSSQQGQLRLYLTLDLSEYVEVAEEDVVHRESLATDQNPIGGTLLWVKQDAKLLHTRAMAAKSQADFLRGAITGKLLREVGPEALKTSIEARALPTLYAYCTQVCSPGGLETPDCPI